MQAIIPMLSYMLPLIGKLLLMIPVVPNKIIPFVLGALNIAQKYWVMLTFPTVLQQAGVIDDPNAIVLAGVGGEVAKAIPFIWGIAEQYLFHKFYEGERNRARLLGSQSWWEKGKRSIF